MRLEPDRSGVHLWCVRAAILGVMALVHGGTLCAATFTVTNTTDSGVGSLRQAMLDSNASPVGDVIQFQNGLSGTITLDSELPVIVDSVTIQGPTIGSVTVSGDNQYRVFFVHTTDGSGNEAPTKQVNISDLTIANGCAKGGDGGTGRTDWNGGGGGGGGLGGGLLITSGQVTIEDVAFSNNTAIGGSGGTETASYSSGGGGGLGGDGGSATGSLSWTTGNGGGGIGISASGGNDSPGGPGILSTGNSGGDSSDGESGGNNAGGGGGGGAGSGSGGGGDGGTNGDTNNGGNGGFGGGGGGGGHHDGGNGGFGGGGGGAGVGSSGNGATAGSGGFGGGGGGTPLRTHSVLSESGFGGGIATDEDGGGGLGAGGAVFVRDGASLTINYHNDLAISGGSVQQGAAGGTGAGAGQSLGAGIFLGEDITVNVNANQTATISDSLGGAPLEAGKNDSAGNRTDGGLNKTGDGTLTLSVVNSYVGGTTISRGTLSVGADNHLGAAAGGIIFDGGTLEYSSGFTSTRAITVNAGGGTVDTNGNTSLLSGNIGGVGALAKSGAGTLTLSGVNSYAGGTSINGGALLVAQDGNLGNASGGLSMNGGTLQLSSGFTSTRTIAINAGGGTVDTNGSAFQLSGSIGGAGSLTKLGAGTLTLSGTNTYGGGTTVLAGTLAGNTASLQGNITNNGAVEFNQTPDETYAGQMSGTGSLAKAGTGKLTLSGTNTYGGGTTVLAGTLAGNTASLQGNITNNGAVEFNQAADGTYSGVLSGSGSLAKTGTGKLTLSDTNTYGGGTTVSAGILAGNTSSLQGNITNNGAVEFNQSTDGTYAGDMSGSGSLVKSNLGTLTLSGGISYTGDTTIGAGCLILNGTSTSDCAVDAGARFGGNATIANLNSSGTVAPGNSIGTITVNGDFIHDPSGTYEVEINDSGQSDLIDVNGTATINGGTVDVRPETGTYLPGSRYTILETAAGVTGTFDTLVGSVTGTRLQLVYNPNTIELFLAPLYLAAAQTPNQKAVAFVLEEMALSPTGDIATVLNELDSVIDTPGSEAYFDQLDGEIFGMTASVGVESSSMFLRTISRRLRAMSGLETAGGSGLAPTFASRGSGNFNNTQVRGQSPSWLAEASSNWRPWAQGYGLSASGQGNGNTSDFTYGINGATIGVDRALNDNTRFGLVGGYVGNQIHLNGRAQRAFVDSGQFAVYAQRRCCCRHLTAILSYAHNSYDTSRQLAFGSLARTASANYAGNEYSFYLERGHSYKWGAFQFQPYGALQYINLHQSAFSETGAGGMNLVVDGMQTDSFRGQLGSRLVWYDRSTPGRVLAPELRAIWRHEFLDENRLVSASFAGAPGSSYGVLGADLGRDVAALGGGYTIYFGDRLSIFANYDLLVNNTQVAHAGTGGLQFLW